MVAYLHKVHYYETDKMGITHHSNYIRWMEEARVEYMEEIGWSYVRLEKDKITSPLLGISCEYKSSTTFSDIIAIDVWIAAYNGLTLEIGYSMVKAESGKLVATGKSKHCFLDGEGRPLRVKKELPEFDQVLRNLIKVV